MDPHPLRTAVYALRGELAPTVTGLDDRTDQDLSHLKHVPLAHCGGYPLVAAGAACECFVATTCQGLSAPMRVHGGGDEARVSRAKRGDPSTRRVQPRGLVRSLTVDKLREAEDGDVGDDDLWGTKSH
jgi:hypothetical protein